jgi:hypothetical protein
MVSVAALEKVLDEASEEDMMQAREDYHLWVDRFSAFVKFAEILKGPNAFGYGIVGKLKPIYDSDHGCEGKALFLVALISFRKHGAAREIDLIKTAFDQNMAVIEKLLSMSYLIGGK